MVNRKTSFSNRLSVFLIKSKKNWLVLFLVAIFAFASGIQASSWLIQEAIKTYDNHIGWKNKEELTLNRIAANMQLIAIKQVLNTEPMFVAGQGDYKEYTFKQRGGWVQIIVDKNERTVMYSIAACEGGFKPKIRLSNGRTIRLNSDNLASLGGLGEGETLYFISGATANSYLLEGGYAANPGNYQSFYAGATDSCGAINVPAYAYDALDKYSCKDVHLGLQGKSEDYRQYDKSVNEIAQMRNEVTVNTVVVTAPGFEISDLDGVFSLGPNRLELRVLPQYNEHTLRLTKTIPYYN